MPFASETELTAGLHAAFLQGGCRGDPEENCLDIGHVGGTDSIGSLRLHSDGGGGAHVDLTLQAAGRLLPGLLLWGLAFRNWWYGPKGLCMMPQA